MELPDFEIKKDTDHIIKFDLGELNRNLDLKSNDYEKLEYLESLRTEHQEWVNYCTLQIVKILNMNQYRKDFSLPERPCPIKVEANALPTKISCGDSLPLEKIEKQFPDYLLHEKRAALAERLKAEFATEKGKGIRLMIEALMTSDPPLITIENRQRKIIYNALKDYFCRDIGSRQSIFDLKSEEIRDDKDFQDIKVKLNFILKSLNEEK